MPSSKYDVSRYNREVIETLLQIKPLLTNESQAMEYVSQKIALEIQLYLEKT